MSFKMIDPRGKEEDGVGSGVTREVYSYFWTELANSHLVGRNERVPFVRHDMYLTEWNVIGKIITKGIDNLGSFTLDNDLFSTCVFEERLWRVRSVDDVNQLVKHQRNVRRRLLAC